MNSLSHEYDDQHRLDLLVDGELSDTERRQLLSSLDEQPGGWRRCALAFLEAQSWGQDLRAIAPPAAAESSAIRPQATSPAKPWWNSRHLGSLLVLAASLLICFGLGLRSRDWWQSAGRGGIVGGDGVAANVPAGRSPRVRLDRPATDRAMADSAEGPVSLVLDHSPAADAVAESPIFGMPSNLLGPSAAVPADVLRALEHMGSRVRQQQLIPVRLNDGREAVVPVNRIELQPVNLRNYQ